MPGRGRGVTPGRIDGFVRLAASGGMDGQTVLIAGMKDEGPFALEWVAHHLALGFDRVAVATNDCTDGTAELLDALAVAGWALHVRHVPAPSEPPQHSGYAAIRAAHPLDRARWLAVTDADVLIQVHVGAGHVADLLARAEAEAADVVSLHARTFAGEPPPWTPGRMAARFRRALPLRHRSNTVTNSFTRDPGRFRAIHNHCLVGFRGPGPLRVLRGDGSVDEVEASVPLWQVLRSRPVGPGAHDLGQLNHYATKTRDAYELRRRRGRGGAAADAATERHTEEYWEQRAGPGEAEPSIDRHAPATLALMAEMLADPAVAAAQAATEAEWARRTAAARQASGWRQEAE